MKLKKITLGLSAAVLGLASTAAFAFGATTIVKNATASTPLTVAIGGSLIPSPNPIPAGSASSPLSLKTTLSLCKVNPVTGGSCTFTASGPNSSSAAGSIKIGAMGSSVDLSLTSKSKNLTATCNGVALTPGGKACPLAVASGTNTIVIS